jgi:hypothetical protein
MHTHMPKGIGLRVRHFDGRGFCATGTSLAL